MSTSLWSLNVLCERCSGNVPLPTQSSATSHAYVTVAQLFVCFFQT